MLVNRQEVIPVPGGEIVLAGAAELKHGEARLKGLLRKRPERAEYRVLLSHYPALPEPESGCAPDLMLSGHTHGGQFNALGLTPYSVGFERLYGRRIAPLGVAGWMDMDGARLLISKGIGASRIPLRVGVRPEIEWLRFE